MAPVFSSELGVYRGRFAPSPSGSLHFGSLIAAVGSYLDAKAHHGKWLVRIEDIDTPRVVKGASDTILYTLEAFGLHWDESVAYQSQRLDLYQYTLNQLIKNNRVYACTCTRKEIKAQGGIYLNSCKNAGHPFDHHAIRIKQSTPCLQFHDRIQGLITVDASFANEDFIIKRSDGLFAYQLVVVLDDIEQGISHIVRGADLLEPTVRQISIYHLLNQTVPTFAHLPLAVVEPGFKLSKQNHAPAIDNQNPLPALCAALSFLGFTPPIDLLNSSINELLNWATAQWQINLVPKHTEIVLNHQ